MEKRHESFVNGEDRDRVVFWDTKNTSENEGYEGGYFYRSDMKEFFEKLENINKQVVGIVFDKSYNLEFITKDIEKENA